MKLRSQSPDRDRSLEHNTSSSPLQSFSHAVPSPSPHRFFSPPPPAGAIFSSTPPPLSVPVTASEVTYARWDLLFSHFGFAVCQRLQSGTLSLSTAPSSTSMSLCSKSTVGAVRKRPRGERVVVVTARRQTSSPGQVDPAPHAGSVHPCFDRRRLLRGGWAVCHESSRGTNCVLWLCQLLVDRARARSIHAKIWLPARQVRDLSQ